MCKYLKWKKQLWPTRDESLSCLYRRIIELINEHKYLSKAFIGIRLFTRAPNDSYESETRSFQFRTYLFNQVHYSRQGRPSISPRTHSRHFPHRIKCFPWKSKKRASRFPIRAVKAKTVMAAADVFGYRSRLGYGIKGNAATP